MEFIPFTQLPNDARLSKLAKGYMQDNKLP